MSQPFQFSRLYPFFSSTVCHMQHDKASSGIRQYPMLKRILIGLSILVLAFGVFFWIQLYHYPKAQIAGATHQSAPDFTLADAQGNPFTLSSQKGHKVVLYFYRGYW